MHRYGPPPGGYFDIDVASPLRGNSGCFDTTSGFAEVVKHAQAGRETRLLKPSLDRRRLIEDRVCLRKRADDPPNVSTLIGPLYIMLCLVPKEPLQIANSCGSCPCPGPRSGAPGDEVCVVFPVAVRLAHAVRPCAASMA